MSPRHVRLPALLALSSVFNSLTDILGAVFETAGQALETISALLGASRLIDGRADATTGLTYYSTNSLAKATDRRAKLEVRQQLERRSLSGSGSPNGTGRRHTVDVPCFTTPSALLSFPSIGMLISFECGLLSYVGDFLMAVNTSYVTGTTMVY